MKCGKTHTNKHPYLTTNNPTVFPMVFVYFLSLRVAPFKSHAKKKKAASPVFLGSGCGRGIESETAGGRSSGSRNLREKPSGGKSGIYPE